MENDVNLVNPGNLTTEPESVDASRLQYRGETKTGNEFGNLIIASADDKKTFYRILFTADGKHAVGHPKVKALSQFFEIEFVPAKLDGQDCLLNAEKL